MMHRRSTRTGLPIPGAARLGRSHAPHRDNFGPVPRQNHGNSAQPAATMIAQHPPERGCIPDQPRQNVAAPSQTEVSDEPAQQQSP
jgi:hypothetical protein